jgi:hypothetical protein
MRDVRRKAVRPADVSPAGRDGGPPRTRPARGAAMACVAALLALGVWNFAGTRAFTIVPPGR